MIERPISQQSARKALMLAVKPLFDVIEKRSRTLEHECLHAFNKTGFNNSEAEKTAAWEILPHQYVESKLFGLDDLMFAVRAAIKHGSAIEISESLRVLQDTASIVFAEVEEFLDGSFSRQTKVEWERMSSWRDWVDSPSFNWLIGSVPTLLNPDKDGAYS